jgi:beta propeller repeat protein
MKLKSIAVLATLLAVASGFSGLVQARQVTQNSNEDSAPQIDENIIVWQGRDGNDWEIFLCDVSDPNSEPVQITNNGYGDISPQTDGNYVVWLGFSDRGGEIFLYNISTRETLQITNDSNLDSPPQIANGHVVWASHVVGDSVEPGRIFLYDIATGVTEQVSDGTWDDSSPRIDDNSIIWVRANATGASGLFIRPLDSGTQSVPVPDGFVWADTPQNDGDLTVLTRYDGCDREVFVYSSCFGVYEQITTDNSVEDRSPVISGGNIAWVRGEGEVAEIFVASYNGDLDGDGIPYSDDNCPCENATGFDADDDGCIDTISGLDALIQTLVEKGVVDEQMRTPLVSKIENARRFADKENICNAIKQLETLMNQVNAQREKKISIEAANQIIAYANSVVASYLAQLPEGESC